MGRDGIAPIDYAHFQKAAAIADGIQPIGHPWIGERQHDTAFTIVVSDDLSGIQ
jgi:hypothetical protein